VFVAEMPSWALAGKGGSNPNEDPGTLPPPAEGEGPCVVGEDIYPAWDWTGIEGGVYDIFSEDELRSLANNDMFNSCGDNKGAYGPRDAMPLGIESEWV